MSRFKGKLVEMIKDAYTKFDDNFVTLKFELVKSDLF